MDRATRIGAPLAGALVALVLLICGSATSSASAAEMRIGRLAAVPAGARPIGAVASATRMHVTLSLRPRNPQAMAAYAQAVSTPESSVYRGYLSPAQFGRRFGASLAQIVAVKRGLRARGLHPGAVDAARLTIPVTATAGQLERAFSVSLRRLALHGRRTAVMTSAAPALDARIAHAVQAVVGLDSLSAPRPLLVRAPVRARRRPSAVSRATAHSTGTQACATAQAAASSQGAYTAGQIASAYGFSGLYAAGDRGAGTTVAVYELEPVLRSDLAHYQSCYGTHTSISYVRVDGGAGAGAGSGEAALDIENLIGLAPAAKVVVYQGQNSNSAAPGAGPYDTFRAIVDQDRAQVISVSWGECEAALGPADAAAESLLFEQAAIQGQTVVSASGDSGSEDCTGSSSPQTELAVDDPSSQPFVTGVGGTSLQSLGPRPTEAVWNGGGAAADPLLQSGAGGGGVSALWSMPPGQHDAAASLHVLSLGPTGVHCGHSGGYCRETPDVSADADPLTGYVVYWNGSGASFGQPSGWQVVGGTSAAAPVWAAVVALADSSRACSRGPIGYAVPALYRAASSAYAADFNDVRTGNNDFTGTNGGMFAAGPGYDEASGLGTPNATALATTLCDDSLRLAAVADQRSALGAFVSLRLRAGDARGATLRFHAPGLPSGLTLNPSTGRITGRPRRRGTFHVGVSASDSQFSLRGYRFTWVVGTQTRIVHIALTGAGAHRPRLSFTVLTGRSSPAMKRLAISSPAGLRIVSTGGLAVQATAGKPPQFTAAVAAGRLTVALKRGFHSLRIALAYPGLRTIAGRQPELRGPHAAQLGVTVLDTDNGTSRLQARL